MTMPIRRPLPSNGTNLPFARPPAAAQRLPGVLRNQPPPPPPRDGRWAAGAILFVLAAMLGSQLVSTQLAPSDAEESAQAKETAVPNTEEAAEDPEPPQEPPGELRVEIVEASRFPPEVLAQITAVTPVAEGAVEPASATPPTPEVIVTEAPAAEPAPVDLDMALAGREPEIAVNEAPIEIVPELAPDGISEESPAKEAQGASDEPVEAPHVGDARDGAAMADIRILGSTDPDTIERWLASGHALLQADTANGPLELQFLGPNGLSGGFDVRRPEERAGTSLVIEGADPGFSREALRLALLSKGFPTTAVLATSVALSAQTASAVFAAQTAMVAELQALGQLPQEGVAGLLITMCLPGTDRAVGIASVRRRSDGALLPGAGGC